MPNCLLDEAQFKAQYQSMKPDERVDFLVGVLYRLSLECPRHRRRTARLEYAIIAIAVILAGAGLLGLSDLGNVIPFP